MIRHLFGATKKYKTPFSRLYSSRFNLLLDTPIIIRGLEEVVDRYDIFLLDQFGVLHDGANPLAGAIDGVRLLKEKNKSIVILSNTSSRASTAVKKFIEMGFPPDIPFVTSGEIAWNYLDTHFRGKKCTWITWRRHAQDNYLKSLQIQLASVQEADFIFFHGTQTVVCDDSNPSTDMSTSVFSNGVMDEPLREVLSIARARNIPAICANMDLTAVLANGRTAHMPGLLKALYEDMGGEVISFGKPQKEFFETAISIASKALETSSTVNNVLFTKKLKSRTIHVGDSLHHDIQGAIATNIDSILVTAHGVHRNDLAEEEANDSSPHSLDCSLEKAVTPLLIKVTDLCDKEGIGRPYFILRSFAP